MCAGSNYLPVIRSDFNEITSLEIINQLKENLQNHKFSFETNHNQITSDLIFIKKFVSQINELRVYCLNSNDEFGMIADGLNLNEMEEIKYKLSNSNIKVSVVVFVASISFFPIVLCFLTVKNKLLKSIQNKIVLKDFIMNFC